MKKYIVLMIVLFICEFALGQTLPDYYWLYYTLDKDAPVGSSTNLVLDSNGLPHIAYGRGVETRGLKYARFDGNEWIISVVDADGHGRIKMVLDKFDRPHIIYHGDVGGYAVKYAHYDGNQWNTRIIDEDLSQYVFYDTTIGIDAAGTVHMTYVKTKGEVPDMVTYAHIKNGELTVGIPVVEQLSGVWCDLTINPNDEIALALYGFPGILWGSLNNDQWQTEDIIFNQIEI